MPARFSIIIPAYNEERFLPRLLASIYVARAKYGGEVEVIVADNSSTDLTAHVAESMGAKLVTVRKRCIAAARNGGARAASGEILCFIDADSAIHIDTFTRIDAAMRDPAVIAGATGVYLERLSLPLALVYCLMVPFMWLTKFDTGVVFCRRGDFAAIVGYDESLLVAEDVNFLWALKKRGRKLGQHLIRLSDVRALGSTRKFDEHGDWHYFALLGSVVRHILHHGFALRSEEQSPEISNYWYQPNR